MERLTPLQILRMHNIETFDDPRSTEQIVTDLIAAGRISLSAEIEVLLPKNTVYLEQ
jgi:hypothetical protein